MWVAAAAAGCRRRLPMACLESSAVCRSRESCVGLREMSTAAVSQQQHQDKEVSRAEGLAPVPWDKSYKRTGALALKIGMLPYFDSWGERHAVTVLQVEECHVVGEKTMDKHGYTSLQLGAGLAKSKNMPYAKVSLYERAGVPCKNILSEFRVSPEGLLPVGTRIRAQHFLAGQRVNVQGITKGKGFQGGMKRHGFKGQRASHGNSKTHRHIGSTGQCQDPGKVFKGKKMPGRMGGDKSWNYNLKIMKIDTQRDLLFVKGHVAGNKGSFVWVHDGTKPEFPSDPPFPTFIPAAGVPSDGVLVAPARSTDPFAEEDMDS